MDAASVAEFRVRLNAFAAARLTAEDLRPILDIDAVIDLRDLDDGAVADVFGLAPFGFGNPGPCLAALNVEIVGPPQIVKDRHMRIRVRQNGKFLSAMGWNMAELAAKIVPGARVDIAFSLEEDDFSASRGYSPWQAILKDIRVQ